jgi:hypothetical protein
LIICPEKQWKGSTQRILCNACRGDNESFAFSLSHHGLHVECNQRWSGLAKYPEEGDQFERQFLLEKGNRRNTLHFFLFGTVCWN